MTTNTKEYMKKYYQQHKDDFKRNAKKYRGTETYKKRHREYMRKWHKTEKCKNYLKKYKKGEKYKKYMRIHGPKYSHRYFYKIKLEVFAHYSNNDIKCNCCGEKEIKFLTIDHINSKGLQHRKQIRKYGSEFYVWLKKNNYPKGYQVLCFNCNCGKRINHGICPHKETNGRRDKK